MKHYNVVCAIVENEGHILCMQRPYTGSESTAGKWEFPGGKIEEGESAEEALKRELREEMDYEVNVDRWLATIEHRYPDFSITLHAYMCHSYNRQFNRKEHIDHRWLIPADFKTLDWAKADEKLIPTIFALF